MLKEKEKNFHDYWVKTMLNSKGKHIMNPQVNDIIIAFNLLSTKEYTGGRCSNCVSATYKYLKNAYLDIVRFIQNEEALAKQKVNIELTEEEKKKEMIRLRTEKAKATRLKNKQLKDGKKTN